VGDRIDPGSLKRRQAMAAVAGVLFAVFVAFLAGLSAVATAQFAVLSSLMATVAVTDYFIFRVPDWLVLAIVASGLGFGFALGDGSFLVEAILRIVLVGLTLLALREVYFRWRGFDGLGLGDVKLIAAGAAWIELVGIAHAVLIAALAALAVAGLVAALRGWDGERRLPFATFLAPSIAAAWLTAHW